MPEDLGKAGQDVAVHQDNGAVSVANQGSGSDQTVLATSNNEGSKDASARDGDEKPPAQVEAVEKAMGDLLDRVQKETNFPVETPGEGPPSTRLNYDVAAQLAVNLQTKWTLFTGFELTDINLAVGVSKRTRTNAAMSVALEARMQLDDMILRIRGDIPRLQEDEETDFVLSVDALAALTSIPLDALLPAVSSGDVSLNAVKGAIEPSVADQLFLMRPGGYAVSASLTITRRPASSQSPVTYYVKNFEAKVMGEFDWEIVKDQLSLTRGGLAVVAQRESPTDKLDWAFTVMATLRVAGSTPVQIVGRAIIEKDQCTGLSFKAHVGAFMGVSLPGLMDAVAGNGATKEAEKNFQPPPSLDIPSRAASYPLSLSVDLRNSKDGWSLLKAEASMFLHGIGWSPLDGITLESLSFLLLAQQKPEDKTGKDDGKVTPAASGKLSYVASVRGVLVLMGIPLTAEIEYNHDEKRLIIQASVPDNTICSLRSLAFGIAQRLLPPTNVPYDPKYDLGGIVDQNKGPQGCPVATDWALHGNMVSRRQCTLLMKESALARASLKAYFDGPLFAWKLSEGLQLLNAGLFFDLDFQPPASTSDPSIVVFIHGSIALSKVVLSGFVACSKTPDRKSFDVLLTIHNQPNSSLGLRPTDVLEDKLLIGDKIDTDGWSLPGSLPPKSSLEDSITSLDATVKASFLSEGVDKPTYLTGAAARLAAAGSWPIFSGLELKDLVVGVVATRKDPADKSPFDLLASLYGRSQVVTSDGLFDIWCHALLSKDDHSTAFTATLTACTADTAKEPPEASSLAPMNLTQLDCLGKFPLDVSSEKQPPSECPYKVEDLVKSTLASCTLRVVKEEPPESKWDLAEISFALMSTEVWALSSIKLTLDAAKLRVTVASPTDAAKRSIIVSLAARMTVGLTTKLDALLNFSTAENRKILEGYLKAGSTAVDMAQLTKELVPQQSDKAIPEGTSGLNLPPKAKIRFWLDIVQPTILLAGETDVGRLLYLLHRPDPTKDENIWLLSLSIQNVAKVFPWLHLNVTGAFSLQDICVQMLSRDVVVQNLITYLSLAQQGSDIIQPQQQVSPIALLQCLEQKDTLQAGGWFIANVNIKGGGSMNDALALAVSPNSTPVIIFYAQAVAKTPSMKCALRLSNVSLWGDSLALFGGLTYSPFNPSIAGDITLILSDLSSHVTPKISAEVYMDKEKTRVSAKLEAGAGGVDVEDPFDKMFNTKLAVLAVEATYLKPKDGSQQPSSTITVSGSLRLGPADSTWIIQADVVFIDGKARLVRGQKIDQTDTKTISDKLLAPKAKEAPQGATWPSDFPLFAFRSACVYYARSVKPNEDPLVIDGEKYYYGYGIAANLILFGAPFTITASLPENRSGLRVVGKYKQMIDLVFAKLYGYKYKDKDLPVPSLIIDTTGSKREYMVTTGMELFSIKGLVISLSYKTESKEKDRLTGTLEYKDRLLGWDNPSISLVYQDGYLFVDEWPMSRDGENVNKDFLQNAIRDASKLYGCEACGDLVDLVLDKTIKTKFDFKLRGPQKGGNPVQGKTYVGSIHWSYVVTIKVPGMSDTNITLDMDPVDLTIDKGFTADSIWDALFKLLVAQAPIIGTAILKNKAKFVLLIGLMNMKGVAKKLLNNLLCRDYDAENVKKEADAQLEANKEEPGKQATSTEVAFSAVAGAAGFAAALVEFGVGVGAVLGFLGLGLLFGAVASLAAHLLPLLGDKTRADAIALMMEEYKRHLARCDAAEEKATQHLLEVARPSAAPALSWETDTPSEASVAVDLTNALPKPPAGMPDNYFGDYSSLTWEVAYSFADNPDATSGVTVLPPTHDLKCTLHDPAFVQQHSVYVWFRTSFVAKAREGTKTVTTAWSPPGPPLSHAVYLPKPKGLDVAISNSPFDQVSVTISEPKNVRYRVAFAADEQSTGTPAYEVVLTGDVAVHTVPVLDFKSIQGDNQNLKAFIRELSSDGAQFRDSPWTASDKTLTVVLEDLNLSTSDVGSDALLEWNSLSSAPNDFTILAIGSDEKIISTTTVEQSVEGDRIRARLRAPEFRGGETVSFAVRRPPKASDVLVAFQRTTHTFRMELTVSGESFCDGDGGFLDLYVNSTIPLAAGQEAVVNATSADGNSHANTTAKVEFYDATKGLAKLTTVYYPAVFNFTPRTISVEITLDSSQPAKRSPPWTMPDPAEVPTVTKLFTYYDKTLRVGWKCVAQSCRMDLVTDNLDTLVTGRTLTDAETWGDFVAEVSGAELDRLIERKQAKIQIWCTNDKGTWKRKEKHFSLPDLTVWNAPDKTINDAGVAVASSLTDMSMLDPRKPGALWWLRDDLTRFEGLMRTDGADGWTAAGAGTNAGGASVLAGGSSVASCSRATWHQEVLWIDGNGGIRGMFRRGGTDFLEPSDYTFSGPGTAAVARGGSLAALACAPDIMDLWYVSPDGLVRNAHWDGNRTTGWWSPTTVASGVSASADDLSIITACAAGTGVAELFWVQKDTTGNNPARWMVQNRRCGDTRAASPQYDSQVVNEGLSSALDPAPNTKVHAMYLETTAQTTVAWITAGGAVQIAVRKGGSGSDGGGLPPWNNLWTIGPEHIASPRSRLCSDSIASFSRAGAVLPSFYWVADDGCVVVADYLGGDSTGTGGYWATYKHTTNVGWRSATPDPPAEIMVCSGTADGVRLFWVGGDGHVWNMRRQKS